MREFRIVFAQCDASGILRKDIAQALGKRLAAVFGGYTLTHGVGGYIMADGALCEESVFVFDVGTIETADNVAAFAAMTAAEIKRAMGQESIYFRNIHGGGGIL